jgi:hypothetical protein
MDELFLCIIRGEIFIKKIPILFEYGYF